MPSVQLQVIESMLRDAADRYRRRGVPTPVIEIEAALTNIEGEWLRRQGLVNDAALLQRWNIPSGLMTPAVWTAGDASELEDRWESFFQEES